uniref:Tropomodulin n=1 Tax=Heterorhabditis bacteriophora TaxID=37862 RepID=A0A1I7XFQ7_HETBA
MTEEESLSIPEGVNPEDLMTDEDFVKAIEAMGGEEDGDIGELLKAMNENRIISWEEAERILSDTGTAPVKSSLPEQTRPTEPDNDTDVDKCVQRLLDNDPTLKEVNLNNMKRTPIPQIRRLIEALAYNEHCEKLSLANMGLYDNDAIVLVTVIEMNSALKKLNLETNYLSGEFFAKLFKAALINQTLEEVKAVNQGVSFATTAEKEIIDSIVANTGLTKVSVNLRLPEGRHKIENATLRNGEYKRILRREAALKAKKEAEELAANPVPKLVKEPKVAPRPASAAKPVVKEPTRKVANDTTETAPKVVPKKPATKSKTPSVANPTIASAAKEKSKIDTNVIKKPPLILPENSEDKEKNKKPVKSATLSRRTSIADKSATPVLNIATGDVRATKFMDSTEEKAKKEEMLLKQKQKTSSHDGESESCKIVPNNAKKTLTDSKKLPAGKIEKQTVPKETKAKEEVVSANGAEKGEKLGQPKKPAAKKTPAVKSAGEKPLEKKISTKKVVGDVASSESVSTNKASKSVVLEDKLSEKTMLGKKSTDTDISTEKTVISKTTKSDATIHSDALPEKKIAVKKNADGVTAEKGAGAKKTGSLKSDTEQLEDKPSEKKALLKRNTDTNVCVEKASVTKKSVSSKSDSGSREEKPQKKIGAKKTTNVDTAASTEKTTASKKATSPKKPTSTKTTPTLN